MPEQDITSLQKTFKDMVGFRAIAEISEHSAAKSAGTIVDVEERLLLKQTDRVDLFSVTIATSQLLIRAEQRQKKFISGSIPSVEDRGTLQDINEKLSHGNLPPEEIKRLTKMQYVANPRLGANKAMDLFMKISSLYGGINKDAFPAP